MYRMLLGIVAACCCLRSMGEEAADPGARFGLVFGEPGVLQDLGADWSRSDFTWAGIERTAGVFDFSGISERVAAFDAAGKHILPILDYAPAWDPERAPCDPATLDQWANYVDKTVRQFHGTLKYWQIWNEPNLGGFWKPRPDPLAYAELLRRSYETIKAIDPALQVIGVNTSDIDLEFAERVFQYGGLRYLDIVAVQPYRIAPEVGHFEEVAALRALMQRYGEVKPIWFTEMGNDSRHFPFKDSGDYFAERPCRRQSAFLVRYMTIIQVADIQKVFWFAQTAEGASLLDQITGKPRPSYRAYQHLIDSIGAFHQVRPLVPPGSNGLHAYLFTLDDRSVLVAWSVRGPQAVYFPGEVRGELRDMFGGPLPFGGDSCLYVDEEPRFLFLAEATPLSGMGAMNITPSQVWLEPGQSQDLVLARNTPVTADRTRVRVGPPRGVRVNMRTMAADGAAVSLTAKKGARAAHASLFATAGTCEWPVEISITPPRQWSIQGNKSAMTPAILKLPDGDQTLLVASFESSEVLALSLDGAERWRYVAECPINDTVATGNISGDAAPEIVAAVPGRQIIFALEAGGVLLWRARLGQKAGGPHLAQDTGKPVDTLENPAWRWTHPVLGDLDGDGFQEIVYADRSGVLTVLDGMGNIRWSRNISEDRCDQPVCLADLTGDGGLEIVCGDRAGTLFCLNAAGDRLWSTELGGAIETPVVSAALQPESGPVLLAGTRAEELVCLNAMGDILWRTSLGGTMDLGTGIAVGDLDGDGAKEIVVTTRNHRVFALGGDGEIRWQYETGAQFRTTPVLFDIDEDGIMEVFAAPSDWRLYCLNGDGALRWTVNTSSRIDSDPVIVTQGDTASLISTTRSGEISAWLLR